MAQSSIVAQIPITTDPTVELGNANLGIIPWSAFYDTIEDVPELAWPNSPRTYETMRHDEQIAALLQAFFQPILGYRWYVDPNGARDEVVEHVSKDFNLPVEGASEEVQGRTKDRFVWHDYLRHALLKIAYGVQFFEQVYRFGDDEKLHIRKLAPRMLGSIWQIQVEPDGGLNYIRQYPSGTSAFMDGNILGLVAAEQPERAADQWADVADHPGGPSDCACERKRGRLVARKVVATCALSNVHTQGPSAAR